MHIRRISVGKYPYPIRENVRASLMIGIWYRQIKYPKGFISIFRYPPNGTGHFDELLGLGIEKAQGEFYGMFSVRWAW